MLRTLLARYRVELCTAARRTQVDVTGLFVPFLIYCRDESMPYIVGRQFFNFLNELSASIQKIPSAPAEFSPNVRL